MSRILLIIIFSFACIKNSLAQTSKFEELSHKMFFNILIHKPDSIVCNFVQAHFPYFIKPVSKSEWTIYPPGFDTLPNPEETMHSLSFKSHPYFIASFKEGRLDVLTNDVKGLPSSIRDFQLWFMFDSKEQAENGFEILKKMFDLVSKSSNTFSISDRKVAEYSDKNDFDRLSAIQFILTKDELYDSKYKIFFRIGALTYWHP